jgi:hypothetical protein
MTTLRKRDHARRTRSRRPPSPGSRARRGRGRVALAAVVAALFGGGGPSSALAAQPRSRADLSITIRASTPRVRPGQWVFFTVTVTNHGPAFAVGEVITVITRGGLLRPRLVSAPPEILPRCSPAGAASSSCRTEWTTPRCSLAPRRLTCRYADYELAPAPGAGDSLTLVIKARAGRPGRERALAAARAWTPT